MTIIIAISTLKSNSAELFNVDAQPQVNRDFTKEDIFFLSDGKLKDFFLSDFHHIDSRKRSSSWAMMMGLRASGPFLKYHD